MSAPVTAAWPLDTLVGSLARAGWGELADHKPGVRLVLRALTDLLPHGSAEGRSTASQIAEVCGLSERWVRHCLAALEATGVLSWRRGWVEHGRRVASQFRVCKKTLAGWVRAARNDPEREQKRAKATTRFRERLATRVSHTIRARRRPPVREQVRPVRTGTQYRPSPPLGEEPSGAPPPVTDPTAQAAWIAKCRVALRSVNQAA